MRARAVAGWAALTTGAAVAALVGPPLSTAVAQSGPAGQPGCTIVGWGLVTGTEADDVICVLPVGATAHVDARGGDDVVHGTARADVIDGGHGDDVVHAGGGDDVVDGGPGDDRLHGGDGADTLDGGRGDDELHGGDGDDRLFGGEGADGADGGEGADHVHGDAASPGAPWTSAELWWLTRYLARPVGPPLPAWEFDPTHFLGYLATVVSGDELRGGPGDDRVFGELGSDRVFGGPGDDLVRGGIDPGVEAEWNVPPIGLLAQAGDGGDWVAGDGGRDVLYGDAGVDLLFGGADGDRLRGGPGYDGLDGESGIDVCEPAGGVTMRCEVVL